jgi:hypothetical protein
MAKIYVTRCIVKWDGKTYKKGQLIKGLTEKEIKQGISQSWLTAVADADDEDVTDTDANAGREPANSGKKKGGKKDDKKKDDEKNPSIPSRDELLVEAGGLGILDLITDETPIEEIQEMIAEANGSLGNN